MRPTKRTPSSSIAGKHLALHQPGVDPHVQVAGQVARLADRLPREPHHAFGAAGVAPSKDRVDKPLPQPRTVVVAAGAEAGHHRIVHRLAVVAVVRPTRLVAVDLDGERVDVQCAAEDLAPLAGGPLVACDPLRQRFAHSLEVGLDARNTSQESPIRRLAGQAFVDHLGPGPVPDGHLHRHVVGHGVGVVLVGVAEGKRVDMLAEQFSLRIAGGFLVAWIDERRAQVGGQAEALIDLAEQDGSGIGGDVRIDLTQLDRLVKSGLEEPSVCFTHWVYSRSVG
jgi:hypothetical protein